MPLSESPKARQAWAEYLALGPGRSLEQLAARYQARTAPVPTRQLSRLKVWSSRFGWQARLQALAAAAAQAAADREAQRVRAILETGFAAAHERVQALNALADALYAELTAAGGLWLDDVKGIGQGDNWTQVAIKRFNSAEIEQFRALLDDIAREVGGRPKTVRVDIEQRVRVMAEQLGLDPDAAVREAAAIIREAGRPAA